MQGAILKGVVSTASIECVQLFSDERTTDTSADCQWLHCPGLRNSPLLVRPPGILSISRNSVVKGVLPPGGRLKRRAVTARVAEETGAATLAGTQLADGTYGDGNELWLSQEAERLCTMQKNPGDGLMLTRGKWAWEVREANHYRLRGTMKFLNITAKKEIFVPDLQSSVVLLSKGSLEGISTTVKVIPRHPGGKPEPREDGYWQAYITRAGEGTSIEVVVDIRAEPGANLESLKAARLDVSYWAYGPHGRTPQAQQVVLPLQFPAPDVKLRWRKTKEGTEILPIPTHLLCHLDDPLQVMHTYVVPHIQPGDVLALGETPLAILQGRFRHPSSVRPSWVARLACRPFHPTSSLATACGMQVLIDVVGRLRIIFAVIGAIIGRLFGKRGVFYNLAGEQARLIDDVTGTLPPYDQFIALGPLRTQETVDALKARTGCEVAVVDVNDLKKVQILAASDGVDHAALTAALLDNPAGNADEQTPLVLVRGASLRR